MKFKELPEGHYLILRVLKDIIYVEKREIKPEELPFFETDPYKVVHDGRTYRHFSREIGDLEAVFKPRSEVRKEERRERKSLGAKYGIVTKHLIEKKPMKGKTLETALSLVTCEDPTARVNTDPLTTGIAQKLKAGKPLSDYEAHLMIDVWMLHDKLSI